MIQELSGAAPLVEIRTRRTMKMPASGAVGAGSVIADRSAGRPVSLGMSDIYDNPLGRKSKVKNYHK